MIELRISAGEQNEERVILTDVVQIDSERWIQFHAALDSLYVL